MKASKILWAVLAAGMAAVAAGYFLWNEKTPLAAGRAADAMLTAPDLFHAFTSDEVGAGKKYNDQVVQVTGTVRAINTDADGRVTVLLETGDDLGSVACEFPAGAVPQCEKGAPAAIKGFCAGYNLDVLLQRCAEVK